MIQKLSKTLITLFAAVSFSLMAPLAIAGAAGNPFNTACQGSGSQSAFCKDSRGGGEDPLTGSDGIIMRVVNIVAIVAGIAAVIIIVLGGLRFVTSGGSSDDVAGARRTIIYASVGLVIIVLARTIVAFVLGKI